MPRSRYPARYNVKRIILATCHTCNQDITRAWTGEDVTTMAEMDEIIKAHEEWHLANNEVYDPEARPPEY